MSIFDAAAYGPVFAELLKESRLMPLDPGTPNHKAKEGLDAFTVEAAFAPRGITDLQMADACRSALWLYHDYLDISHTISQQIETETGSYWHGIMHRREPDYSNSKYWFRRVGDHPVFPAMRDAAAEIAGAHAARPASAFLTAQTAWDPYKFIDLCETANKGQGPAEDLCRKIQHREWELLFDYCYHAAVAG